MPNEFRVEPNPLCAPSTKKSDVLRYCVQPTVMGDDHARCSVSDMHSSLAGVLPGHALVSRHSPLSLYTHVKVAEENLLGTRDPDVERGFFLHMRSLANDFGRQCNGRGRARPPMRSQPAPAQLLDDQEGDEEKGNEDDDEFLHTRLRALALFWLGARLTNRAAPSLASIDPFHRHTADCARYVV